MRARHVILLRCLMKKPKPRNSSVSPARVEADPDEKAWDKRLRKIAAPKPVPEHRG